MRAYLPPNWNMVLVNDVQSAKNAYLGAAATKNTVFFIDMEFHVGLDLKFE